MRDEASKNCQNKDLVKSNPIGELYQNYYTINKHLFLNAVISLPLL